MIVGYGKRQRGHSPLLVDRDAFLDHALTQSIVWVWAEDQEDFEVIAKEFAKQVNSGAVPHIALLKWASHALTKIADGKDQLFKQTKRKLVANPPGKGRPKKFDRDLELVSAIELERQIAGVTIDDAVTAALKFANFRGISFDAAKQTYKRKRKQYSVNWDVPPEVIEEMTAERLKKKGQK